MVHLGTKWIHLNYPQTGNTFTVSQCFQQGAEYEDTIFDRHLKLLFIQCWKVPRYRHGTHTHGPHSFTHIYLIVDRKAEL